MLDHLSIQCADVAVSAAFYDTVLPTIGGSRIMDFGTVIGYGNPPMPDFWLGPRATGEGFRESHIAFTAPDRETVHRFFDAAVAAGTTSQSTSMCGNHLSAFRLAPPPTMINDGVNRRTR